jgi:nicotinamide mononucleotide transporter
MLLTKRESHNILFSLGWGSAVFAVTAVIAELMKWPFTTLEGAATLSAFICTLLCVKQSRWNYPVGVLCSVLLFAVFYQSKLLGSAVLQLYLIPTLIYGWFIWGRDDKTKPVETVSSKNWILYIIASLTVWAGAVQVIKYFGGELAELDSFLLFGSIFAQFLLDRKKIETWYVWALVNIVSIYVYFNSGLYLVGMQFVVFLGNTIYGYVNWKKPNE